MVFVFSFRFGIAMVAMAFMLRAVIMTPVSLYITQKHSQINILHMMLRLKGVIYSIVFMVLALILFKEIVTEDVPILYRLLVEITVGAVSYIGFLYFIDKVVWFKIIKLLKH